MHGLEPARPALDLRRADACDAFRERTAVVADELDRVAGLERRLATDDPDREETPPLLDERG